MKTNNQTTWISCPISLLSSLRTSCIFVNSQCDLRRSDQPYSCLVFLSLFFLPFLFIYNPLPKNILWPGFSRSLCLSIRRDEAALYHLIASYRSLFSLSLTSIPYHFPHFLVPSISSSIHTPLLLSFIPLKMKMIKLAVLFFPHIPMTTKASTIHNVFTPLYSLNS